MSSASARQDAFIEQHLKRNIVVQLAHGMLGQTGFRIFNAPTFLPVYLYALSGSELLVGLARSLQAGGQVLTPMLGASMIGHRTRILNPTLVYGALMRIQILLVALTGLYLGTSQVGFATVVLFMTLMGIFQGIQGVMMNSLRAKVIPVSRRGFVSGWRNFLAGATTASLSFFAGSYFIEHNVLGDGYAAMFILAFVITSLGLAVLSLTREPEAATVRQRQSMVESYRALPELFATNPAFARFFLVSALGSSGRMAMPFYILYAATRMDITGTMLGVLTTLWMLTGTATNVIWGAIADRQGYRVVLIITLALWTIAHIQLLFANGIGSLMAFFVVIGTAVGGFNQARQNMVLEMGSVEDIPLRVAISNMAVNAIGTAGPLLGGVIATIVGYLAIFVVCIVTQVIALFILITQVPEPRTGAIKSLADEEED